MKPTTGVVLSIVLIVLAVVMLVDGIFLLLSGGYLSGIGPIIAGLGFGPMGVYNYRRTRRLAANAERE